MVKYKIGDKIIFSMGILEAYHQNLIPQSVLTQEDIKLLERGGHNECRHSYLKFYGKVIEIAEKENIDKPYRLVYFLLSNGTKLGVLETHKNLRKANLLERIVKKFSPE